MRVQEIRDLTLEDLRSQIGEARKELVNLRFQHAMRKLETPHKIKATRRMLSRMLTIEAEKLNGEPETASKKPSKAAGKSEEKIEKKSQENASSEKQDDKE